MSELTELHGHQARHPIWTNRLFLACEAGALTREDFRYVFAQYHLYSKSFTRYLAALMARCEDDAFRARITENLWEESGGADVDERHSQIFRRFLHEGLGIDVIEEVSHDDYARHFAREYLDFVSSRDAMEGAAFLSLGTEGIVARMYGIFVKGLLAAGVPEEHLRFFRIHMECDDAHAATIEELMLTYAGERGFADRCRAAMNHALDLRMRFFENAFDAVQAKRLRPMLERIQARNTLTPLASKGGGFHVPSSLAGTPLYTNTIERLGIEFSVEKLAFRCEVLDPRVVHIPPGKRNEHHRHAHETVFVIVRGRGRVLVDDVAYDVAAGDLVFAPRWCMHQTQNTGDEPMTLLAVTDYGLTSRAFVGDYEKTARLKRTVKGHLRDADPVDAGTNPS